MGIGYFYSRVHITSVTLEHLNGAYKVEDSDGYLRDPYLKEHNITTFLVINPKVSFLKFFKSIFRTIAKSLFYMLFNLFGISLF